MICLMADLPFSLTRYGRITRSQCYRIPGRHSSDDADRAGIFAVLGPSSKAERCILTVIVGPADYCVGVQDA
jgi:hypothetical protein